MVVAEPVQEIVQTSGTLISKTISGFGGIMLWLQALGIILILWLIFQIINIILNTKAKKQIEIIEKKVMAIDRKLNKVLKLK